MTHRIDALSSLMENANEAAHSLSRKTEAWRIETQLRSGYELERKILERALGEARELKDPAYWKAHREAGQLLAKAGFQAHVTSRPETTPVLQASDPALQRFADNMFRKVQEERETYLSEIKAQLSRDPELSRLFEVLMLERHDPYYLMLTKV